MRRVLRVVAALATVASCLAVSAPVSGTPAPAAPRDAGFSATKDVTRTTWFGSNGSYQAYETTKTVTVTADQTKNLRGRQRVRIAWSGAQPSGARASNPYGEQGLNQEYPVVVLQCRGTDEPALAPRSQVRPETCWTSSFFQRSQVQVPPSAAIWTKDPYATAADRERLSGMTPFPTAAVCPTADTAGYATALTPFQTRDGRVFPACDKDHMPAQAGVGAAFPPAEIAAFTDLEGNGSVLFEVRSDIENESLGCNDRTACSIVVIPIMGTSCAVPTATPDTADLACKKGGQFAPGTSNFANQGVDAAVSPALWWAESNWRNRISIPITFGLPPDTCDILDPRAPTGFYGSELLAQASLQWSPAYCLEDDRFKFQHNQMPDSAGFAQMLSGGGAAAEVSSAHDADGNKVAYAPTAVTGFGVGYVIDRPDNAGEYGELKLNARLLAKLLTQSYPASGLGRDHPGLGENPVSINLDPEFQKLNPGLSTVDQEAAATILSLSESSDVIEQVTDYIAHDPAARAFVSGKPDPWGMRVNPSYRDVELPVADWPLLDTYIPETGNSCRQANPGVYLQQVASPVPKLNAVAQALIDAQPNVSTRCDTDVSTDPPTYKLGRIDRQSYGSRFLLGIVSLGDAARYGLRSAALATSSGRYVAPTDSSLARGVALMRRDRELAPFVLDQADVRQSGDAYPGTMVVYTAARTQGVPKEDAQKVAQFIRISTTEGQRPGSGNGELPAGFLPIRSTGPTAKLLAAARAAATVIEAQQADPVPAEGPGGTPDGPSVDAGTGDPQVPADVPGGDVDQGDDETVVDAVPELTSAGATTEVDSSVGRLLLPLLIGLGLFGGLGSSVVRIVVASRR